MTIIFQQRIDELHVAIQQIPEEWRYHWCGPDKDEKPQDFHACACMGAVNCSGRLGSSFTKKEWLEWVAQNPPKVKGVEAFIDENGRYNKDAHDDFMWSKSKKKLEETLKRFTVPRD